MDHSSQDPAFDDVSVPHRAPRWWSIVWSAWGLAVGVLVLWLDANPWTATLWFLFGTSMGRWSLRVVAHIDTPVLEWLEYLSSDPERDDRLHRLLLEGNTQSEAFHRLLHDEAFETAMATPLMVGLVHGTWIGGIAGALCSLDSTINITASQGALCGILVGIIGISFLVAAILALLLPLDKTRPLRSRLTRRARMFVAPLIVFPLAWHCGQWIAKRRWMHRGEGANGTPT